MANKRTGAASGTGKQGLWYFGSSKSSAGKPSVGPKKMPVVTQPRSKEIVIGKKPKTGILD